MVRIFQHTRIRRKSKSDPLVSIAATKTYALPSEIEFFPLEFGENLKELLQKPYKLYRKIFLALSNKIPLRPIWKLG